MVQPYVPLQPHVVAKEWIDFHKEKFPVWEHFYRPDGTEEQRTYERIGVLGYIFATLGIPMVVLESLKLHQLSKIFEKFDFMAWGDYDNYRRPARSAMTKFIGRVGVKAIPVIGTASLVYDGYMLAQLVSGAIKE